MIKKYPLIILILSLAVAALADGNIKDNQLSISVNTMSMDYTEYALDGSFADSENTDSMTGFGLSYATRIGNGFYGESGFFDVDFSLYHGDTRYDGYYLDKYDNIVGSANNLTTNNTITEGSLGYFETKSIYQALWFTRVGIGYREWERDLSNGHNEKYSWFYGSLSTGLSGNIFPSDNLGISAEYHRAFSPEMKSNGFGTFDLGRTDGYSISIPWIHTLTPSWALKFAYTYQTWDIEHSTIHPDGHHEPRSESYFNIFNAALIYRY